MSLIAPSQKRRGFFVFHRSKLSICLRTFKIGACGACFLFQKAKAFKKKSAIVRGVLTSPFSAKIRKIR